MFKRAYTNTVYLRVWIIAIRKLDKHPKCWTDRNWSWLWEMAGVQGIGPQPYMCILYHFWMMFIKVQYIVPIWFMNVYDINGSCVQ